MALDEEKILAGKFVFISYSHANKTLVEEDVKALLKMGVRAWYDVNMEIGDTWTDVAEEILRHENCAGVIFYNSPNAFISEAVQKEQNLTKKLGLSYWYINIDGKKTAAIKRQASNMLADRYGEDSPVFCNYEDVINPEQGKMFSDEILCIYRTDSPSTVERIYKEIATVYGMVDNEDTFMDSMSQGSSSCVRESLVLGRYVGSEYIGPEQANDNNDQRFGDTGNLIQLNGKRYYTKELHWKLMYVDSESGKAVLLCNKILSQSSYQTGKSFLDMVFPSVAFLKDEREKIGFICARYMTLEDLEKCTSVGNVNALKLGEAGKLKHWWIDAQGLTENWKQTFSDDFHYPKGFSSLIKKGIRPVIEISARNIY